MMAAVRSFVGSSCTDVESGCEAVVWASNGVEVAVDENEVALGRADVAGVVAKVLCVDSSRNVELITA